MEVFVDTYEILYKWNLWGDWGPDYGQQRMITNEICAYLDEPEVITIIGPRRAGKSTVMYQMMQALEKQGVNRKSILHINFEEPALSPFLKLSVLDELYNDYRSKVFPEGKAYIFLDEIQNVAEWERWVRARNDTENIKIIITGSSSALLSRELGTLLTGRHLTFDVYPMAFSEQLQFKSITIPEQPWPNKPPAQIQHALNDYLKWGGMPRIVLSENKALRERLLKRYFEDMLYKDIIMRHEIRDVQTLRNIAVYLLTQTASLISYKRLCDLFSASHDLVQSYCQYLQEAFIVEMLPLYTLKTGERIRNPLKTHAVDLGIRKVVSYGQKTDSCKLIESMVFRKLLNDPQDGIFYWRSQGEVDLLTRQGIEITQLIQVSYSVDDPKIFKREVSSLLEAGKYYPQARKMLIVFEPPVNLLLERPEGVELIPMWHLLLS